MSVRTTSDDKAGGLKGVLKHSFTSGLKIVFLEKRVPWIVKQIPSLVVQGLFHLVPFLRTRICKIGELCFEYRPATPDLQVLHEVVERDEYQISEMPFGPHATVIDIGAHLGSFSVLAASRVPEGVVFSYEPDSANFRLLTRNVARNKLTNVRTFLCAVSNAAGPKTLFRSLSNWSHSLNNLQYSRKRIVDCVTLPQILNENKVETCQLLKIDCEGSEYEILMGLSPQILARIERIVGEWHPTAGGPKELGFKHLGMFLEAHGFSVEPDPRSCEEEMQGTFRAIRRNCQS